MRSDLEDVYKRQSQSSAGDGPIADGNGLDATGLRSVSYTHLDVYKRQNFAFARANRETDRAVYQAMEAFVHNLNTMHSRAGAQIPFSSINYGMDTTPEGRMIIKNVLLATEGGLGNGETPIFPIHIFKVKEGVNLSLIHI